MSAHTSPRAEFAGYKGPGGRQPEISGTARPRMPGWPERWVRLGSARLPIRRRGIRPGAGRWGSGHPRGSVLLLMEETFRGWAARAAWLNARFHLRHRRHFDKVAIVGAPTWEEWCAKLSGLLITGEIKTFKRGQLSNAWTWLRG
jgi:hypothetical protein